MGELDTFGGSAVRAFTSQFRIKGGVTVKTLTGNVSYTARSGNLLVLDPGGASRDVTFPPEQSCSGLVVDVYNTADAPEDLVLKDDAGGTIITLGRGESCRITCNGSAWAAIPMREQAAYSNTAASAAHTNTTDEALFDKTYSIPANALKAGTVVRISYQGIATATNGTDTLTIKLRIGGLTGTVLITHAATDVANNDTFSGEFVLVIRTVGAGGTCVGHGWFQVLGVAGTATVRGAFLPSTAIDTTAAQVVGVSADWSVANPGNSARLDVLTVEIN